MISRLVRIGIDGGEIGYLAPVFKEDCENHFEYIPVPCSNQKKTSEKRTYGTISARNKNYGTWLSDFMHVDKHRYKAEKEWRLSCRATDIIVHYDPEWGNNNTFGINHWVGYLPRSFDSITAKKEERYLFFFSGLSPYDEKLYSDENRNYQNIYRFQKKHKEIYLIGYIGIKEICQIKFREDFQKHGLHMNAHFKETAINENPIIVKGYDFPNSRLREHAIQLNEWNEEKGVYVPNEIGKRIGIPKSPGIMALSFPLGDIDTRWLLEIAKRE